MMFRIVDKSQQPAMGYMEVVSARDAAVLLPIIQTGTAPGTTINSVLHTVESDPWGM